MSEEATLDEFAQTEHSNERKETPIGELPADWDVEWLNSVVTINSDGFSEDDWPSDTFEYISLSEASNGDILGSKTTRIDEAPSRAQRTVQQGDVLVGTVRPKQKSHGLITEEHDCKICSSGFGVLRTGPNLNSHYLIQEVLSNRFFSQMEAYVAGSGYPAVKLSDLKKHRVSIPPLSEQRKIATVLYTVDQAIEKTEKIINHTGKLRKALIDNLFVTGYREHREQQTQYIGPRKVEYPAGWASVKIEDIAEKVTKGKTPTSYGYDYLDSGINFIKAESILDHGGFDKTVFDHIGKEAHKHLHGSELQEDDVLFSIAGALGKVEQVTKEVLPANTNQALALIRIDEPRVSPEYVRYYLETTIIQKYIQSIATTTAQSNLNLKQVSEFRILLPDIEEQQEILEVIHDVERKLKNERTQKQTLERFKQGLMQDLLSGTVRTTDTNITVPDEVAQHG